MPTPNGQYAALDNKNLIGLFDKAYEEQIGGAWATTVGMAMPSDMGTETYGWLGAAPSLEELRGDMTEEQLANFSYVLKNVEYAKSLKIAEKDMRRDKLGQIQARIGDMASKAADHWDSLLSTLITANSSCYDGTPFFGTAHAESGTSQVNALTSAHVAALDVVTAAAPTADEAAKALVGVIGKFYEFVDDKGDPANGAARNFTVVVGTAELWSAFNHANSATQLSSGETNRVAGLKSSKGLNIEIVLNPRLRAHTTKFWVFRTDGVVKAFILQEEVAIDPQVTDKNSDEYKKFRRFLFNIYTSRAAGYGNWKSALQATFS